MKTRMTKGQYGIYGIVTTIVLLVLVSAFSPSIEGMTGFGLSYLNSSSMEYLVTGFVPALLWTVIIGWVIITAAIRR
jgi:hypothetical protein